MVVTRSGRFLLDTTSRRHGTEARQGGRLSIHQDARRRGRSFAVQMANAEFKINKPNLLIEACKAIDAMQISSQNQDVQGDLYEYLLSKLNTAGKNGQFQTPRHIIRMMVKMLDPSPGDRICDPAAGPAASPSMLTSTFSKLTPTRAI